MQKPANSIIVAKKATKLGEMERKNHRAFEIYILHGHDATLVLFYQGQDKDRFVRLVTPS
jgi:hypothetical protein